MKYAKILMPVCAAAIAFGGNSTVSANEERDAIRMCEDKIRDEYDVSNFHNVWADSQGHHKYKVHGKVNYNSDHGPFDCVVKNGYVRSYHYSGPHPGLDDDDDDKKKALAIGAGLALAVAVAAAASKNKGSKSHMEDDCREEISSRLREDHHDSANFRITSSDLDGDVMTGEATARWDHTWSNRLEFTCYFDSHNRVSDSSYYVY